MKNRVFGKVFFLFVVGTGGGGGVGRARARVGGSVDGAARPGAGARPAAPLAKCRYP